jgi:hypothetical protein
MLQWKVSHENYPIVSFEGLPTTNRKVTDNQSFDTFIRQALDPSTRANIPMDLNPLVGDLMQRSLSSEAFDGAPSSTQDWATRLEVEFG